MSRYGFIGLGNLGKHLAANLARGGFELAVFDLNRASADAAIAAGAGLCGSGAELAKAVGTPITRLPSPAASAAVVNEALPFLHPGSSWSDKGTKKFAGVERLSALALRG